MEAGEKELRKAFEDVTTGNVKTILDFSTVTRKIVRDLETRVVSLELKLIEQNKVINELKMQLASVQMTLFNKGTNNEL